MRRLSDEYLDGEPLNDDELHVYCQKSSGTEYIVPSFRCSTEKIWGQGLIQFIADYVAWGRLLLWTKGQNLSL